MVTASSPAGVPTRASARPASRSKKPPRLKYATTTIMPRSSPRVAKSMAATACSKLSSPNASTAAPPARAMPGRSVRSHGKRPTANPA